jgi:hypothetical protein
LVSGRCWPLRWGGAGAGVGGGLNPGRDDVTTVTRAFPMVSAMLSHL